MTTAVHIDAVKSTRKNVVSLDKIDKELKIRFKEARSARERILAWLVEGCLLWKHEGLDNEPREVTRANSEYRRSQNPISLFLEDYCVEDRKSDEKTKGTTVKEFVDTFNYHRGEYGAETISSKSFGRYMKALSYESYRVADKRGYKGIRLKTQKEIDADADFNEIEEGYKRADEKKEAIGALYELIRGDDKYTHLMTYDVYNAILPYISINIPNQCVFRVNAKNGGLNVIRHKPANSATSSNVDQSKLAGYVIDVLRDIKNAGANLAIKDLDDFLKGVSARVKMLHHEYQHYDVKKFTRRLTTEDKIAQGLLADIMRGGKKATSATEAKRHSAYC